MVIGPARQLCEMGDGEGDNGTRSLQTTYYSLPLTTSHYYALPLTTSHYELIALLSTTNYYLLTTTY